MDESERRRHDKSWNDPPLFTYDQLNQGGTTAAKVPINKRYRYPAADGQQQLDQPANPMLAQQSAGYYGQPQPGGGFPQQPANPMMNQSQGYAPGNYGQQPQHQQQAPGQLNQGYGQANPQNIGFSSPGYGQGFGGQPNQQQSANYGQPPAPVGYNQQPQYVQQPQPPPQQQPQQLRPNPQQNQFAGQQPMANQQQFSQPNQAYGQINQQQFSNAPPAGFNPQSMNGQPGQFGQRY